MPLCNGECFPSIDAGGWVRAGGKEGWLCISVLVILLTHRERCMQGNYLYIYIFPTWKGDCLSGLCACESKNVLYLNRDRMVGLSDFRNNNNKLQLSNLIENNDEMKLQRAILPFLFPHFVSAGPFGKPLIIA